MTSCWKLRLSEDGHSQTCFRLLIRFLLTKKLRNSYPGYKHS